MGATPTTVTGKSAHSMVSPGPIPVPDAKLRPPRTKVSGCMTSCWEKSHRCWLLGSPENQSCLPLTRGLPHTQSFQSISVRQTENREAGSMKNAEPTEGEGGAHRRKGSFKNLKENQVIPGATRKQSRSTKQELFKK